MSEVHVAGDAAVGATADQIPVFAREICPTGRQIGGGELTTLGAQHSDRFAGLIYLDAARDPIRDDSQLAKKLADAAVLSNIHTNERSIQSCAAGARVVELRGSDHYVFIVNEEDVLCELRAFLAGLKRLM